MQDKSSRVVARALLIWLALFTACVNEETPQQAKPAAFKSRAADEAKQNPGRLRDMRAKCDETTEAGKQVVEKLKAWTPIVNGNPGDKPLREVAEEYVTKGIYEICWGATEKSNGKWKAWFDYIDIQGAYKSAEWEYDPATGGFSTFNKDSMTFWTGKL